jgi:Na+-transporting NADH:ubiquinone oxidoreductase subunit NqrC
MDKHVHLLSKTSVISKTVQLLATSKTNTCSLITPYNGRGMFGTISAFLTL